MRTSDIKKLFPITVEITKEILDSAFILNSEKCIGALALKSILPDEVKNQAYWGCASGGIWKKGVTVNETFNDNALVLIQSVDENGNPINMMNIREPQTITFNII